MLKKNTIFSLILTTVFCLLCQTAFAQQTDNGSLNGMVSDPTGAVVPNATVNVANLSTGLKRSYTTNTEGRWTARVLPLGNYEVTAEATGFQAVKGTATVTGNETVTVDLVLSVGPVDPNQVTINPDDDGPLTNPEGGTIASNVTGRQIEDLPVANRTPFGLLQRDTSTSGDLSDPIGVGNGNPEVSNNGARTTSLSVTFNGADITNFSGTGTLTENISPAPETVQEVTLSSSNYDVSIGRTGGGNIQLVTKSGGNKFNGTAYIYAQNEAFNANDFFFNRDGIDRQKARKTEGGFTLGGPIIKEKLFFFGGYQRTDAITAYVPTAQTLVTLPEALMFITDRSNPESVRQAFSFGINRGGANISTYDNPSCIRDLSSFRNTAGISQILGLTCIDPTSIGFRLLSLRNPITGDYFIPTVRPNAERLVVNTTGAFPYTPAQLAALGLPNGIPVIDTRVSTGINSGLPLVRQRSAVPAEFEQDQFTIRLDHHLLKGDSEGKNANTLSGTFFFANFPSYEPFPDETLASPAPLVKDDRNRTLAITDTHIFASNVINEARFGYFSLDNSRKLDDRLLGTGLTSRDLGVLSPASVFAPGPATDRMPRFSGTRNYNNFSVGAPNDIFNKRQQVTFTFADNLTYVRGDQTFRFGVEHKRNYYDTSLPEEQAGDYEGFYNWGQFLLSWLPEADSAFGITDKQFRFNDLSFYISDDWRFSDKLTLNLGLRWDWFGRPVEKNGSFANFDFSRVTDPNNIATGFILPANAMDTGIDAIDASLPTIARADNNHTLNGQDLNNFAPRIGFAWKPFKSDSTVIRGGYGLFYDRPSAAFINTVYSNYPYLREIEATFPRSVSLVPVRYAFDEQNPNTPFSSYFPFRVIYDPSNPSDSPFYLFDSTPGVRVGSGGIIDGSTGRPATGNVAEPIEFRAVDRDLKTPLIQQWNLGIQHQLGKDWVIETRYVGSRGQNLLLAVGFNQPYDLNDPNTPDYIFKRLNDTYAATNQAAGQLRTGVSERLRGAGIIYGGCNFAFLPNPFSFPSCFDNPQDNINHPAFDYNVGEPAARRAIVPAELRVPYLGFDPQDAIILQSRGYSIYHSGQLNVTRRFSKGYSLNFSYTFSKSIDIGSTDPGSTAASGRPDTPNLGLVVQGDQRNLDSNRAVSDFDRPHRFAGSFVWELPNFGSKSKFLTDWQLSGFGQWQSGSPFSILVSDANFLPQGSGSALAFQGQYLGFLTGGQSNRQTPSGTIINNQIGGDYYIAAGTGTIFGAAFARPNIRSLEMLRRQGDDWLRAYFNNCQDPTNPECPFLPGLGGFGNLGRNVLRGPSQKRIDISLQKTTKLSERISLELKWDIFNIFNFVNFANPNADLSDETDFGQITHTVGAPRVMQFGAKIRF
jgi:hypothetical protein